MAFTTFSFQMVQNYLHRCSLMTLHFFLQGMLDNPQYTRVVLDNYCNGTYTKLNMHKSHAYWMQMKLVTRLGTRQRD